MSDTYHHLLHESYLELTARARVAALVDSGSFRELCAPTERIRSPHLAELGLPRAFDDGIIVGDAQIKGRTVMIAAQEGGFMGGAVGEVHGAKLTGLLLRAVDRKPDGVIILADTGGVRLHEANAGLIAMGEIQRAVFAARDTGIPVIVAIGSANGCYGGLSIVARSCDWIIMSAEGRLSVSGPEVIETARGVEAFDARDRPMVWRTMGGRHRFLIGEVDRLVEDDPVAFRNAISNLLGKDRPMSRVALEAEHRMLAERLACYGEASDATDIWGALGLAEPERAPGLEHGAFMAAAGKKG